MAHSGSTSGISGECGWISSSVSSGAAGASSTTNSSVRSRSFVSLIRRSPAPPSTFAKEFGTPIEVHRGSGLDGERSGQEFPRIPALLFALSSSPEVPCRAPAALGCSVRQFHHSEYWLYLTVKIRSCTTGLEQAVHAGPRYRVRGAVNRAVDELKREDLRLMGFVVILDAHQVAGLQGSPRHQGNPLVSD